MDRKEKNREYMRQRRADPAFKEQEALRMRALRKDPSFRVREREAKRRYEQRKYAQDQEYRQKELARKNALRARQRAVPEYRAEELRKLRVRRRTKYATDAEYREGRKALRRLWYAANREKAVASVQANYQACRAAIVEGYGRVCSCCGEEEVMFLELDHVNGGGNADFKAHKSPLTLYRRVLEEGFPDSFRLLCANCNRGRQRNGGVCPHREVKNSTPD